MKFIWEKTIRWIPGAEGKYAVTSTGLVASYLKSSQHVYSPFWLGQTIDSRGYLTVTILSRNKSVHQLVLETFVGLRPKGMQCCHKDNNKQNNCLSNLRWDTPRNNRLDYNKKNASSCFFGIYRTKSGKKWNARLHISVGCFDTEIEAARAYDIAILKLLGLNAQTNKSLGLLRGGQ